VMALAARWACAAGAVGQLQPSPGLKAEGDDWEPKLLPEVPDSPKVNDPAGHSRLGGEGSIPVLLPPPIDHRNHLILHHSFGRHRYWSPNRSPWRADTLRNS